MVKISQLREQIDEITIQMLDLFKKREDVVRQIGIIKDANGKNVHDESREEQLRAKVIKACADIGLKDDVGSRLLNFLLRESIKVQSDLGSQNTHLSVFAKAKEMEKKGAKIIHMEVGEPDFAHPPQVADLLKEACVKGRVKYGMPKGSDDLREKIAKHISSISSENILVTPGARFAVYLAIETLLECGDEIIIIEPAWPAYSQCATNAGVKTRIIKTSIESGWEPSLQEIESKINSNTKMIILNYPNNPTGKILSDKMFDSIMDIAKAHNMYVLSDEIYSQYAYTKKHKSIVSYGYERSIVAQSFSKSHAMTGFRIGYVVADKTIVKKMSQLLALCMTSVCEPVQYAAMRVLDYNVSSNAHIIQDRLDILYKAAKKAGLEIVPPDGAMYLFCRLPRNLDGVVISEKLLEFGVAVAPGASFGQYRNYIRLSACADIGQLIKGIKIISNMVNA
ncbi:MAG: Aspartate aminotransferase [Cenarchaeum symbiont of Oopsacas minuta]|nr:Aspartate aminotransferase [Cenarchaeum symbiont of Oopsacas minuta]